MSADCKNLIISKIVFFYHFLLKVSEGSDGTLIYFYKASKLEVLGDITSIGWRLKLNLSLLKGIISSESRFILGPYSHISFFSS